MTLVSVLARRLRQEQTLRGIAQAVIAGLRAMPGVIAVAIVGFDRTGTPCVWIGDDSFEPVTVEAYLAGTRRDPCEDRAAGALLRVVPIAGSSEIAGAIRIVASTSPSWNDLALIGAQVSVRLAALGIDPPLSDHLEPVRLSARQREIAWLVARGCTNGEIATIVGCTSHGVKKHRRQQPGLL